jgi:hypothetical protein
MCVLYLIVVQICLYLYTEYGTSYYNSSSLLDLDKYIYPNCLNKLTAYVYVALLLRNKKECVLIKKGASFNFIIVMV